MIKLNSKIKFIFLKKKLKSKMYFNKILIKKSIIQNSNLKIFFRIFNCTKKKKNNLLVKHQCVISNKKRNISKLARLSRFNLHKLSYSNLNLNYKLYDK